MPHSMWISRDYGKDASLSTMPQRHISGSMYSSTHAELWHYMKVSDHLQALEKSSGGHFIGGSTHPRASAEAIKVRSCPYLKLNHSS
jgi:hypothetical protein